MTGRISENLRLNVGAERKERKDQDFVLELPIPKGALTTLALVVCPPMRETTSEWAEKLEKIKYIIGSFMEGYKIR